MPLSFASLFPLGFSASYRPGEATVRRALDEGMNYFFCYGFDGQAVRTLRSLGADRREHAIIATGAYNYVFAHQDFRKTLDKRLRQLRTDYIDVFLFLGVIKGRQFPERLMDELRALKETGKVRAVGMSCHDRKFAGELARRRALDLLMVRYNAAHRGAEQDIFPHLGAGGPMITAYTATCWTKLLRKPHGWSGARASAGQCYRFQLSNPAVRVALTAPRNERELLENLAAVRRGGPEEDELEFLRAFGDAVHAWGG